MFAADVVMFEGKSLLGTALKMVPKPSRVVNGDVLEAFRAGGSAIAWDLTERLGAGRWYDAAAEEADARDLVMPFGLVPRGGGLEQRRGG